MLSYACLPLQYLTAKLSLLNMKQFSLHLLLICLPSLLIAQQDPFAGSYANQAANISLKIKSVGEEYQGLIQTYGTSFAFRAEAGDGGLTGIIFRPDDEVNFSLSQANGGLLMYSEGYQESFFLISPDHQLAGVDLEPYLRDDHMATNNDDGDAWLPGVEDSPSAPSEPSQSQDSSTPATRPADADLFNLIAGGQLVYYTRTSYVNSSTASSMTYVNFCPNGSFNTSTDGSYSVEGNYGGNAHGVNRGSNYGRWEVLQYNGSPVVKLTYANGNTSMNPFSRERLLSGRWRIGNTQYAFQRGKAACW